MYPRAHQFHDSFAPAFPYEILTPSRVFNPSQDAFHQWARFGSGMTVQPPPRLSTDHNQKLTAEIITEVAISMRFLIDALYWDGLLPLSTLQQMMELYRLMYQYAEKIYPVDGLDDEPSILKFDHGSVMVHALRAVHLLLSDLTYEDCSDRELRRQQDLVDKLEYLANVLVAQEAAARAVLGVSTDGRALSDAEVYDTLTKLINGASGNRIEALPHDRPTTRKTRLADGYQAHTRRPTEKSDGDWAAADWESRYHDTKAPSKHHNERRYVQYPEALSRRRPGIPLRAKTGTFGSHRNSAYTGPRPSGLLRMVSEQEFTKSKRTGKWLSECPIFERYRGTNDKLPCSLRDRRISGGRDPPYTCMTELEEVLNHKIDSLMDEMAMLECRMQDLLKSRKQSGPGSRAHEDGDQAVRDCSKTTATEPFPEYDPVAAGDEMMTPATTEASELAGENIEYSKLKDAGDKGKSANR